MNASNCHWIKMNSIRGCSRPLSKFYTIRMVCLNFQNACFREHFLMPYAFLFYTTELFFLGIFLFKESSEKSRPLILTSMIRGIPRLLSTIAFILTSMIRGIPRLLFIMLLWLLYMPSLFKNFSLLTKYKDFDFFNTKKLFGELYWTWFCRPVYTG